MAKLKKYIALRTIEVRGKLYEAGDEVSLDPEKVGRLLELERVKEISRPKAPEQTESNNGTNN